MLTKVFDQQYVPRVPGSPEIPARAAYTVCQPTYPSARWVYSCSRINLPNGRNSLRTGGFSIPPGGQLVIIYDPSGAIDPLTGGVRVLDAYIQICTSTYTPGPPGPPACTNYPEQVFVPAVVEVPAHIRQVLHQGWDAGANSVESHAGSCEASFVMNTVIGVYVGFTASLGQVNNFNRYTHALHFFVRSGRASFRVVEGTVARSRVFNYMPGDAFKIRRVRGRVSYWHGSVKIHESADPSTGTIHVGTSLYSSGDAVP